MWWGAFRHGFLFPYQDASDPSYFIAYKTHEWWLIRWKGRMIEKATREETWSIKSQFSLRNDEELKQNKQQWMID